jgi:hypothetical protein
MRNIVLATMFAAAGCAVQPMDPAVPASAPPVVQAAAAEPVSGAGQMPATKDQSVFVPPAGYKLRPDRGENVYCAKIVVLGTRFPKEVCRTEDELRDQENQRAVIRAEMEQRTRVCSGPGCSSR